MKLRAGSRPGAGPVHRHTRWTGRCSRCTSAASPGEPCSAGTTAGSKQLPLSLQENTVTGKPLEPHTHKFFHSTQAETEAAHRAPAANWQAFRSCVCVRSEPGLTQGRAGSLRCSICQEKKQPFSIGD